MKRSTALRYTGEIAERLKAINGLLATPGCQSEAVRIRRVWVFGSTVKGKDEPNDLDILIDVCAVGRHRVPAKTRRKPCFADSLRDGLVDREYRRRHGMSFCPDSVDYALKWLTKGMKKVSRHTLFNEGAAPFKEQVLIYPRWDFK